ncbi:hypothetical protein BFS35_010785, partial [Macrococcoides goetzii]
PPVVTPEPEKLYSLGDYVWSDEGSVPNVQDSSDKPLSGIKVILKGYDGQFIAETTTDANGHYQFDGLKNGTYIVNFITPTGWSPVVSNVGTESSDSDGPTDVIATIKDGNNMDIDQGYIKMVPPTDSGQPPVVTPEPPVVTPEPEKLYSLGDYVWSDEGSVPNVQDSSDKPLSGIKVILKGYDGQFIAETTTDANGHYQFDGLKNGTYIVNFITPTGWSPVVSNVGTESLDSDGPTDVIATIKDGNNMDIDQGYIKSVPPTDGGQPPVVTPPATDGGQPPVVTPPVPEDQQPPVKPAEPNSDKLYNLGDYVWLDNNHNSMQDSDEKGIEGVVVTLRDYAGNTIATTKTDANGHYIFTGLKNGTYIVNFNAPLGWSPVIANINPNDDTLDSDGPIDVIAHIQDQDNMTVDQGYWFQSGGGSSEVKPAPEVKPGTPEVTPPAPEVKPGTPEVTPPASEVKPGTPEVTPPPAPEVKPSKPEVNSAGNVTTPEKTQQQNQAVTLPDTGEADSDNAGIALLAALGGFALITSRKRRNDMNTSN